MDLGWAPGLSWLKGRRQHCCAAGGYFSGRGAGQSFVCLDNHLLEIDKDCRIVSFFSLSTVVKCFIFVQMFDYLVGTLTFVCFAASRQEPAASKQTTAVRPKLKSSLLPACSLRFCYWPQGTLSSSSL